MGGIDYDHIDLGLEHDIVTKSGSYFSFGDERLGQGRNAARAFLREHPDVAEVIEQRIREAAGVSATPPGPGEMEPVVDPETGEVIQPAGVVAADDAEEAKAA